MWLYLCVCLWWRRPQREAHCLRKESLSKAAAVCTHTHTHKHTQDLPKEGRGEVRQGSAICKSICCLQIGFLLWDSELHNSSAFPGPFPSAIGWWGPEEGNLSWYVCQWVRRQRGGVCHVEQHGLQGVLSVKWKEPKSCKNTPYMNYLLYSPHNLLTDKPRFKEAGARWP